MSRIRSRDTKPELVMRKLLHSRGLRFRLHRADLPGRPDIVFATPKVVVFIDGDFWRGWRFSRWRDKLAAYWREKIEGNRARDARNCRRLQRRGWRVVRIWEHRIESDPGLCASRIAEILAERRQAPAVARRLEGGRGRR
jgi:DNA mismatch endonuclease (patch repair protein)